jgi:hypothetical protein
MTKLEQAIDKVKSLPEATQDQLADLLLSLTDNPAQKEYLFSDEEWAGIEDVLKNDTGSFTVDEVFASLK